MRSGPKTCVSNESSREGFRRPYPARLLFGDAGWQSLKAKILQDACRPGRDGDTCGGSPFIGGRQWLWRNRVPV